jgi:uncharacterized integral membrane protein
MKKTKIGFWALIIIFIALLIYQNQEFFMAKQSLSFKLVDFKTPDLDIYIIFVGFFVAGAIITFLFGLPDRMKTKKSIKAFNETIQSQKNEIETYKNELAALRGVAPEEITLAQDVRAEEAVPQEVVVAENSPEPKA